MKVCLQKISAIAILTVGTVLCGSSRANAGMSQSGSNPEVLTITRQLPFAVDERMKKNVDFWVSVNTRFTTQQGIVHDAKYIDHIYEILDFPDTSENTIARITRAAKKKWKDALLSVQKKQRRPDFPANLTSDEKRVYELFSDINEPDKYLHAANHKRLRWQLGQKERFLEGLKQSGRYLPDMEKIFAKEGLPIELTRLPFVESSFNVRARSKVGASGIWQFMRSTGRLFLRIDKAVDERNDPIRATEAAAKLLKGNYESLHSWPLAVTAYNHGRKGMMRAVDKVGSDELEELVSSYHSRSFGFASTNFFTELLSAIEIEKNYKTYYGEVDRSKPVDTLEVKIPDYVSLPELCKYLHLDMEAIRELNPGLMDPVFSGQLAIPAQYILRLPYDGKLDKEATARIFFAGYELIPPTAKSKSQHFARHYDRR